MTGTTYGISFSRKLREQGLYDEALAAADKDHTRDPEDPEPLYDRGATLYCLGKFEAAVAAFADALQIDQKAGLLEEGVIDDDLFETLRKWAEQEPQSARAILGRYRELMPQGAHNPDVTKWMDHLAGI